MQSETGRVRHADRQRVVSARLHKALRRGPIDTGVVPLIKAVNAALPSCLENGPIRDRVGVGAGVDPGVPRLPCAELAAATDGEVIICTLAVCAQRKRSRSALLSSRTRLSAPLHYVP